jgi:tetratricopeptide (TPR) repeat protein/transcription elongation GreA/GreB family factor
VNPYTINPPESEVAFEQLCLALLKRHWSRPGLERFAKKGEEQFGVDIFDTLGESPLYAAQCKLKEQSKSLDPSKIRKEVEKAETFPSKLDHYAILTTGKISGAAQLVIQAINQEHRAAGLFTVELFTWDKITELIRQYPEIEEQFYGGLRSQEVAAISSKLDYIAKQTESATATSATSEIDALIDEARVHITPSNAQIAVLLLNRIQRTKGGTLSDWHRFRILTNLGVASLMLGKGTEAARYFLEAKPLRPDDELGVANEVLAYHLLLQVGETRQRSAAAVEKFPNSTRLRSLWIQSAPSEKKYGDLLDATPCHMRKDAEVASALCRRAIGLGLIDRGIEHAKDAVADKPKWSQAHLLLAQAWFAKVAIAERTVMPLKAEDKETNLAFSLAAADAAISSAETEGVSYVKAHALALKSDIAMLQGRKEDAARIARESFAADSRELEGRLAMAQASFGMGKVDEAIQVLEEAYAQADLAPNVSFMLGQALMARGTEHDFDRAFEVFSTAKLTHLSRELIDPVIIGATRALVRANRLAEIPAYVTRAEVVAAPVMVATIKAYVALRQSLVLEAGRYLDDAIASRQPTDTHPATDFLARTLIDAGRLSDALPLLQELFDVEPLNFDVGLFLDCASRLKRDKVILDTCQTLYERGVREWRFVEFGSQYLEEYDPPKAISRLQEFVIANPTHRVAKLRLAMVGMRYGQNDLVQVSEEILPLPEELPMRYAVPAIHLLQWHGLGKLAADYAYRCLRAHYSELEAHKAYLASLMAGVRPEDIPATMEKVQIGSAVQYAEGGDAPVGWFVIENTDNPKSEFEELNAKSEIAQELLGKKVGDSFVLAKSPIQDRIGRIVQILSKYTRRFQAIGDQMQLKFGTQSVIQTMHVPPPEKLTAADLQPLLDSVKAKSEVLSKVREIYRSNCVTLHMYAGPLGHSTYDGLLNLAISEDDFVRCALPQMEVLANTLTTLGTKSTVVLDLTALATLRLLGITRQVLTSTAFRFVVSPATFTELQQLRAQSRFSAAGGIMYYEKGQHYLAETTEEQAAKQKAAFEEYMQCIDTNAKVVPVPQLATLTPERRELLTKVFGQYGLESALVALSPGYIWWTDDLAAGEVAKSELGVERAWTQAVLEHIANLGLIDRGVVDEAYAKLIGFDYQSTHFTGAVMVAALRVSGGSMDAFPMRQIIRAFEFLPATNRSAAFGLLAVFILRLSVEPLLPETRCLATKAFLNTFPNDAETNAQLASFRSQCARVMTLNPVAQADFIKCFDQWNKERWAHGYIVKPS